LIIKLRRANLLCRKSRFQVSKISQSFQFLKTFLECMGSKVRQLENGFLAGWPRWVGNSFRLKNYWS
jgi:hypothetical protein